MPLRRTLLSVAVLALVAGACAKGDGGPAAPDDGHSPVPATNAATAELLPTDAAALPDFDLAAFQELLTQLKGTPVVVNIWASWCGPCKVEAPHLAEASRAFGDRVQFLGIDILDARDSARQFMTTYGWTYPSVFDESGAIRDGLGFIGQPVTVFYDANGAEIAHWSGAITAEELSKRLNQLVS